MRRWLLLPFGVAALSAAVLAVALAGRSPAAQAQEGSVAVDCNAASAGVQDDCTYATDASFTIQVHITTAPPGGYIGFQVKPRWDDPQLDYLPAPSPASEKLWPYCTLPLRSDNQANDPPDPSFLFACASFPPLSQGDTTTGAVLQFQFQCQQDGSTVLQLVPRAGDPQEGSYLMGPGGNPIDPTLTAAQVDCTSGPLPTPTPTPDPYAIDGDGDGCSDGQEAGANPALGGQRDPQDFWDFLDTPEPALPTGPPAYQRDRVIRIDDIFRVASRFGATGDPTADPLSAAPSTGYHTGYDRTPPGDPQSIGPADGAVQIGDVLAVAAQFGHTCA